MAVLTEASKVTVEDFSMLYSDKYDAVLVQAA